MFALVVLVFVAVDYADQHVGASIVVAAPLDETAHLLTALLIIWAVGGAVDGIAIPILITSVAIDLDHLPADFGQTWLTAGTPRPYTHSLVMIALVLAGTYVPRARKWSVAIAVGLVVHFWRDLAEPGTGVALFWPVSSASYSLPHTSYLVVMGLVMAIGLVRALRGSSPLDRSPGPLRERRDSERSVGADGVPVARRLIRHHPSE